MRLKIQPYGEASDIAVPIGQSITISSPGAGVTTIYLQTVNRNTPLIYQKLQTLSDAEVTLGPYAVIRYFKIAATDALVEYEVATSITADNVATFPSRLNDAAATLAGLGITDPVVLTANSAVAAAANSTAINAALLAADQAGGQTVIINTAGTVYLAATLVWSKSHLIVSRQTTLFMATSATTDPIPMFRNRAFVNWTDSTTYKVVSSMTYSATTGLVTVTTSTAHGKALGDDICPWGANQSGYNGTFRVHTVPTSTTLTYRPDVPPTVTTATASTFLNIVTPQMRLYTPDVGGRLDCYGVADFNGLWTAGSGGVGDPGNAGTNGSNAATPSTNNSTDFDTISLLFHRGWNVNFHGNNKNSREHAIWICHGRDYNTDIVNISAAGADGVHLTGPLTNVNIGYVGGYTNDNLFAIGSSDYSFFNMSEGDVIGVRIRTIDPRGVSFDPFRVIGESQYVIDYVVDEITGSCYGCYAYHLMYDSLMVQGGSINVRYGEVKRISCQVHNSAIAALQPFTAEKLIVGSYKLTTENQVGVIIGAGATSSTCKTLIINDGEDIYDSATAGYGDTLREDVNITIDKIIMNRPLHARSTNSGTAGNGYVFNQAGGNVKHLVFNDPVFEGGVGLFQLANTIATKIDINNQYTTTPAQIGVITGSSTADVTVAFNGGYIGMTAGFLVVTSGSGVLDIAGGGCYAPHTLDATVGLGFRSAAQVMTVHNWGFGLDCRSGVTSFSLQRGQFCTSNVGGSGQTTYGPAVSNGSVFYTLGTGAAGVNVTNT